MKKVKTIIPCILIAISLVLGVTNDVVRADNLSFPDVKENHWYTEAIHWATDEGIILGYTDGRFKPEDNVTEAQFMAMLVRFFPNVVEPDMGEGSHWSDGIYKATKESGLTLPGHQDGRFKTHAINRNTVAQIIAYYTEKSAVLDKAIEWLFESGLTEGFTAEGTYKERYRGDTYLTRAQAVTFIKRMNSLGFTESNPRQFINASSDYVIETKHPLFSEKKPVYKGPSKPMDRDNIIKLVESFESFPINGEIVKHEDTDRVVGITFFPDWTYDDYMGALFLPTNDVKHIGIQMVRGYNDIQKNFTEDFLKHYFPTQYKNIIEDALNNNWTSGWQKADGIEYFISRDSGLHTNLNIGIRK
ncbi:hypothetical protein BKP35_08965 [Anaerobacillus arseniciselenatis]|uniref:SLH domain-containing protein n=1 Tax=Anaerobacillus arseniciselenatis TaxID=85682 RepID=A0A1S2LPK8_9BACI|nr:S-layer homology domain-containing protein [Anaerobacillus arseniciselenatis]OIJ13355.1 hypothetical protein BKP35_08965 [Anaerobacillus arseniciselenatis]